MGHRGLVGSAITALLTDQDYQYILTHYYSNLDLTNQARVADFFASEKSDYVFFAAAKVGGLHASHAYPVEFIHDNLVIQMNVIHCAFQQGVKRLLFLGSSCISPKLAPQPMSEEYLLSGPFEPSNRPYALAKIGRSEMCWSYNRQYGTQFLAAMLTNLFGPGDNYHAENSKVFPALIRKFCDAKLRGDSEVVVCGTGTPRRKYLHNTDLARASIHLMQLPEVTFAKLLGNRAYEDDSFAPILINIGVGHDLTTRALAELIGELAGFVGDTRFDSTKPDGTKRKLLDINKIEALDWKPSISLREWLVAKILHFMTSICHASAA